MKFTYYDLWKFIQEADVDDFGYHEHGYSIYKLQIYSNKNQVNIINVMANSAVCNIVFDPVEENVEVYKVEQGICNYNDPIISTDINSPISNMLGIFGYKLYPFILSLLNDNK